MGNSASNLPYTIIDDQADKNDLPSNGPMKFWAHHKGKSKDSNATSVSIFTSTYLTDVNTMPDDAERCKASLVPHFYKHCKKLVHPYLVRVIDAEEVEAAAQKSYFSKSAPPSNTCYIVTEPVESLTLSKLKTLDLQDIVYGLHCVVQGLVFLHSNNLALGNFSLESVYVTRSGEWKIFDYSFITELSTPDSFNNRLPNDNFIYNYRAFSSLFSPDTLSNNAKYERVVGVHALDAYNLSIFIEKIFNGHIPEKLIKANNRLRADKPKLRPRLPGLLKCPVFNDSYVKLNIFLNDFMLKTEEERLDFVRNELNFTEIPQDCAKFKILPIFEDIVKGSERSLIIATVPKIFEICELDGFNKNDFQELNLFRILMSLFDMVDRAIRANMLGRLNYIVSTEFLSSTQIGKIFDSVCTGFNDTNNSLREMTLKNMIHLLPVLEPSKIEKLLRYLIKLSSDEEDSIRVNTAIFIGKICEYLTVTQITKFVISTLNKLANDKFLPAKLQAISTYGKLTKYIESEDEAIATKVIPAISMKLIDDDIEVKKKAFNLMHTLISMLEQKLPKEDGEGYIPKQTSTNSFTSAGFTSNGSFSANDVRALNVTDKNFNSNELSTGGWSDDEFDGINNPVQKLSMNDDDNFDGWDDF